MSRRLARLSDADRDTIEIASVIGRSVDTGLLERCGNDSPEGIRRHVDAAARLELIRETSLEAGAAEFSHALLHASVYKALPANRRRALHLTVLKQLEALSMGDAVERMAQRAHHARRAAPLGDLSLAVDYQVAVAESAVRRRAYHEAAERYGSATRLLDYADTVGSLTRAELLLRRGKAETWLGWLGDASASFDAAEEQARSEEDAELGAQIALAARPARYFDVLGWGDPRRRERHRLALSQLPAEPTPLRARVTSQLALSLCFTLVEGDGSAETEQARRLADEALSMARGLDDPAALAACWLGRVLCSQRYSLFDASDEDLDALVLAAGQGGEQDVLLDTRVLRMIQRLRTGDGEGFARDLQHCRGVAEHQRVPGSTSDLDLLEAFMRGELERTCGSGRRPHGSRAKWSRCCLADWIWSLAAS